MCAAQIRFRLAWVLALPLLLSYFFVLCKSQSSGGGRSNSHLTEPGVIAGIIVGVGGILVVIGVSILLCRLFCCKQSSCCACCEKEGTYQDASAVPIKIPTENSPPGDTSLSTISQDRPARSTHSRPKRTDTASTPPQYDDIPQFNWKMNDVAKTRSTWDSDLEGRSQLSAHSSDREIQDRPPTLSVKRNEKAQTRRKLVYEADNPDTTQDEEGGFSHPNSSRKKRTQDLKHQGREFPHSGHKHRSRNLKPSHEEDEKATGDESGRNSNETSGAREFPLLEFEPRKRSIPSYPGDLPRTREESGEGAGGDREFRPVEYDHLTQPWDPPYPEYTGRTSGEEDRAREHREGLNTRGHFPEGYGRTHTGHFITAGRVNQAFNTDSSETTV